MENACQHDIATWATGEKKITLTKNWMLLAASKNDGRHRGRAGISKNASVVNNVMRGTGIKPQHINKEQLQT